MNAPSGKPQCGRCPGMWPPLPAVRAELEQLTGITGHAGVVIIHAVDGMPGVGKTALVTRAAHLLANAFPTGSSLSRCTHTPPVGAQQNQVLFWPPFSLAPGWGPVKSRLGS